MSELTDKIRKAWEFDVVRVDAAFDPKVSESRTPLGDWSDGAYYQHQRLTSILELLLPVVEAAQCDASERGFFIKLDEALDGLERGIK